ncbi:MAG: hypothetical protein WD871_04410 [Xanthobacteraceae bacterium]
MTNSFSKTAIAVTAMIISVFSCGIAASVSSATVAIAQSGNIQIFGIYEGNVARRLVKGGDRETRIYRLTLNPDMNTGKVFVFELERKLRNEMGFVVKRTGDLTYEGETRPIKATPGYIPDRIRLIFSKDGLSVRWYHNDGATEGSGTLTRTRPG